jgi:hypothetical protein
LPGTSALILMRCGGHRAMSCRSTLPHEPTGGASPLLRRR